MIWFSDHAVLTEWTPRQRQGFRKIERYIGERKMGYKHRYVRGGEEREEVDEI